MATSIQWPRTEIGGVVMVTGVKGVGGAESGPPVMRTGKVVMTTGLNGAGPVSGSGPPSTRIAAVVMVTGRAAVALDDDPAGGGVPDAPAALPDGGLSPGCG